MYRQVKHPWEIPTAIATCALIATAANALLLWGNLLFTNSDLMTQFRWATQFQMVLAQGTLYPRWMPLSNLGLGDPTFLYYPPLYFYTVSFFNMAIHDIWVSMKLVALTSNFASGIATFFLVRRLAPFTWSLLAAVAIQTMPFVFFLPNYSAALPWHFATPFLILVISLSIYPSRHFINIPLTLSIAALTVSHILVAFMALICLPFGFIWNLQTEGLPKASKILLGWALSSMLGLGLAMFYLFPAITAQGLISPQSWYDPKYMNWHNSFAFPLVTAHIWGTRWFNLQWVISAIPLAATLAVGLILFRTREERDALWHLLLSIISVSVVSLFLASELAFPLYYYSKLLQSVQWPYRFITIATVCSTLALPLALLKSRATQKGFFWRTLPAFPIALSLTVFLALVYQIAVDSKPVTLGTNTLAGKFGQPEYATRTRGPHWERYVQLGGLKAQIDSVGGLSETLVEQAHHHAWRIKINRQAYIILPIFAFPAWVTYIDGKYMTSEIDPDTGLIAVNVPVGTHKIAVDWAGLPQESIGQWLSLIALGMLVMLYVARKYTRKLHRQ